MHKSTYLFFIPTIALAIGFLIFGCKQESSLQGAATPWVGVRQLGSPGIIPPSQVTGFGVATDTNDNVFLAGYTPAPLDGHPLVGDGDYFFAKYNPSGIKQWTKSSGCAPTQAIHFNDVTHGQAIALDKSNNIIMAGYTMCSLEGNTLLGYFDAFVAKYSSDTNRLWTRTVGASSTSTIGYGVASDSQGNIFLTGETGAGLDGNALNGLKDAFVTKYDPSGNKKWTKQIGAFGAETTAWGVATDGNGNTFIVGSTKGNLNGNLLTGTKDGFVSKFNSAGVLQWTRQLGVAGVNTDAQAVATDYSGNVFITGSSGGGLAGNTLLGFTHLFVIKYNSAGIKQWTKQLNGTTNPAGSGSWGYAITIDRYGNPFVTGSTGGEIENYPNNFNYNVMVAKLDTNGNFKWLTQYGIPPGNGGMTPHSIAVDSLGNVFLGGETSQGYDGIPLAGSIDAIVMKFNPQGQKQ